MMTGMNFGGGSEFAAIHQVIAAAHRADRRDVVPRNSRHILMGAAFEPYIRRLPRRRAFFALFFMCDESWAMSLADPGALGHAHQRALLRGHLHEYLTWISMTTLGAAVGPTIGNIEQYDMAFTAVFLVLLRGMWKGMRASRPWFVSLVVAAATPRARRMVRRGRRVRGLIAALLWPRDA